ncbi:MAG: excinuclease ABC subunit UvrC [Rickettsiales bacterium]|jgi:excinuclease ABC subunit C|nr:excinuclease ABC subunit UvrC [Rickettsiales bacterium]
MNIQFADLIENSPAAPGVYKMYDAAGALLYVGKARNIAARLRQYADISKLEPYKRIMRKFVARIEWELTKNESDALVLEERLIKTQKPKYNIMMTDGKMYPMLALTAGEFPRLLKFRGKISQKRDTFGPYPSVSALNDAIKMIQKVCKLRTCADTFMKNRARPCLLYQIGRCSAPCMVKTQCADGKDNLYPLCSVNNYNDQVALARRILSGDSEPIIAELSDKMKKLSDNLDFEAAAEMRDKIAALSGTAARGIKQKNIGINWNQSVGELEKWLGIKIDRACVFDNSHLFGRTPVGAMIVFGHDGFIKSEYRHFKLKDAARAGNDIAMMEEFIQRADADLNKNENSEETHGLIIVDGGRPQWSIARKTAPAAKILGVVKGQVRDGDEHFIMPDGREHYDLAKDSTVFLLLRAVRDEAHRFAISFHRALRDKAMTASRLDEIEGIGPARKRAVLHYFGSVRQIADADLAALQKVPGLGKSAAEKIFSFFHF